MKITSFLLFLLLGLASSVSSCKKDKIYTIQGKWEGVVNNGTADYYYALNVKSGGTLDVMDNAANKSQITATGTWTVVNGVFSTIVDYGSGTNVSLTSPFNSKSATLTGTWGNTPSTTDGGTWTMTKQ